MIITAPTSICYKNGHYYLISQYKVEHHLQNLGVIKMDRQTEKNLNAKNG